MGKYTAEDKARCIERELKYRRHVYVRLVEGNKMRPAHAQREIALMEEILEDLVKVARGELLL